MNTPVAGPTTTRYPVTGTPLTTTQTTASNSGYPPGIAGFAVIAATGAALLGRAQMSHWYWAGLQIGVTFGTLFVGWLMYQSLFRIQALCPYCMLVWAAMFLSLWYVTVESASRWSRNWTGYGRRLAHVMIRRHDIAILAWFVLVGLLVNIAAFNFS
ncbi:vitamin K epoxide reductase family protein [Nesterenkonia flava]